MIKTNIFLICIIDNYIHRHAPRIRTPIYSYNNESDDFFEIYSVDESKSIFK
jgi:hypothetical protein